MSRKWTSRLGAPRLLAVAALGCVVGLAACGSDNALGLCDEDEVVYAVRGEVRAGPVVDKMRMDAPLVVDIYESTSVVKCDASEITQATPGNKLTSLTMSGFGALSIDVSATIVQGIEYPLEVRAFLDFDEDGLCDLGEPIGTATMDVNAPAPVDVVLTRTDCAPRL